MRVAHLKDETLLRFHENFRTHVEAERRLPHKFMTGDWVKQYAASSREELTRRRLQHNPVEWHSDRSVSASPAAGEAIWRLVEIWLKAKGK